LFLGYRVAKIVKPVDEPKCLDQVDVICIGKMIRARRTQSGLTIEQASALCGVAKQTLMTIEHGNEKAQIGKVLQVLKGFGISLSIGQNNKEAENEWV